MSTLDDKGNNPREVFHLQHFVRVPDSNSCVAVALHVRTNSPVDATISLEQARNVLRVCYGPNGAADTYIEQLKENNLIELGPVEGTPLCVSPNELVQFGFGLADIRRIVEQVSFSRTTSV